ncbi:hypothetical protein [Jatrophihabitans fulvus]
MSATRVVVLRSVVILSDGASVTIDVPDACVSQLIVLPRTCSMCVRTVLASLARMLRRALDRHR